MFDRVNLEPPPVAGCCSLTNLIHTPDKFRNNHQQQQQQQHWKIKPFWRLLADYWRSVEVLWKSYDNWQFSQYLSILPLKEFSGGARIDARTNSCKETRVYSLSFLSIPSLPLSLSVSTPVPPSLSSCPLHSALPSLLRSAPPLNPARDWGSTVIVKLHFL